MIENKPVQQNEIPELRDLMESTFRLAYEKDNDPADFEPYCTEFFSIEKINNECADAGAGFWFSKIETQTVGYFKLKFDLPLDGPNLLKTSKLERIYLLPDFQNRGIGSAMLTAAEEISRSKKQEFLWFSVWKKNPAAIRFYEKNGYEIFGEEIFEIGNDPQVDWLMGKKLII